MTYEKTFELLPELVPFGIYYLAIAVRLLDSHTLFWNKFFYGKDPECEHIKEIKDCDAGLENPLAKAHHEFIFTNLAAAMVLQFDLHRRNAILPESVPLNYLTWVDAYLYFAIAIAVSGVLVKWKGVDSLFFSLYCMSVPMGVIFSLYDFWEINWWGLPFPLTLSYLNIMIISTIMGIHLILSYHYEVKRARLKKGEG